MKKERGQAFILVLILLVVGALIIVPLLQLMSTTLKGRQMYVQFTNEDYAADAATEYGLWKLNWETGYAATLPIGEESDPFCITLNGETAWTTITAQAISGDYLGGQALMNDKISYQVIKGVVPETADVGVWAEFTYTINIRCYDPYASLPDNFLEEIIDTLARGLEYVPDSTSWDEEEWGIAPFEPEEKWKKKDFEQFWELKWKFKDRPPFDDGVEFEYGETKSMSFRARTDGDGLEEGVYTNDITVKPGDKNLGAYQAPIIVGDPDYLGVPGGFLDIEKTVDKDIIYPNEPTTLTYTITLENVDIVSVRIKSISDWLPSTGYVDPAFTYVENSTTASITHVDETVTEVPMPDTYPDEKNILDEKWQGDLDELRWELKWNLENHEDARFDPIFLEPGEVMTMIFQAAVTLEASGMYFNEFYLKDVIRYPIGVEMVMVPDPPTSPYNVHHIITMENQDVVEAAIKKITARLPSADNGDEDEAFIYVDDSTVVDTVPYDDDDNFFKKVESKWEGKKDRWKVEWDIKNDITLEPGEVLTWEFDTTVVSNDPGLIFNDLVWDIDVEGGLAEKITLYSFPTAGTLVPMYDLNVETLNSILSTNAWLGKGDKISPKSTHWKKHK